MGHAVGLEDPFGGCVLECQLQTATGAGELHADPGKRADTGARLRAHDRARKCPVTHPELEARGAFWMSWNEIVAGMDAAWVGGTIAQALGFLVGVSWIGSCAINHASRETIAGQNRSRRGAGGVVWLLVRRQFDQEPCDLRMAHRFSPGYGALSDFHGFTGAVEADEFQARPSLFGAADLLRIGRQADPHGKRSESPAPAFCNDRQPVQMFACVSPKGPCWT